jgi:hypothetical protein
MVVGGCCSSVSAASHAGRFIASGSPRWPLAGLSIVSRYVLPTGFWVSEEAVKNLVRGSISSTPATFGPPPPLPPSPRSRAAFRTPHPELRILYSECCILNSEFRMPSAPGPQTPVTWVSSCPDPLGSGVNLPETQWPGFSRPFFPCRNPGQWVPVKTWKPWGLCAELPDSVRFCASRPSGSRFPGENPGQRVPELDHWVYVRLGALEASLHADTKTFFRLLFYFFDFLSCMFRKNPVEFISSLDDMICRYFDICSLSFCSSERLVYHDL